MDIILRGQKQILLYVTHWLLGLMGGLSPWPLKCWSFREPRQPHCLLEHFSCRLLNQHSKDEKARKCTGIATENSVIVLCLLWKATSVWEFAGLSSRRHCFLQGGWGRTSHFSILGRPHFSCRASGVARASWVFQLWALNNLDQIWGPYCHASPSHAWDRQAAGTMGPASGMWEKLPAVDSSGAQTNCAI